MKLEITKGKWEAIFEPFFGRFELNIDRQDKQLSDDDVHLIADAGNTYQKCEMLPSQLLIQRDDLFHVLEECTYYLNKWAARNRAEINDKFILLRNIEQVIKKAKYENNLD